jgi:DNA (cytosine-5)-methyltransferase 1
VLKVFETFAGYGGASFGLKKAKIKHKVIGFSEFDKYADIIFSKNHPNIKNYWDITKVDTKSLPNFDLFTGGFPCQPFSTAGSGLGEMDIRGTLFYEIIRICGDKQPRDILLENVKGITMGKHKQTFQKILLELENIGYQVHYKILNSKDFGIPQNRERVWIYATKNTRDVFWKFDLKPFKLKLFFKDFLEENPDENLYLNQEQIKRLIELHNVDLNVKEPCCLDIYNKKVRTDGISITLTEPHHNSLRVVEPKRKGKFVVRKLSVLEHFRLMGFKDNDIDFAELSYQQLCKRAGNGWDINVASRIFKKIYE